MRRLFRRTHRSFKTILSWWEKGMAAVAVDLSRPFKDKGAMLLRGRDGYWWPLCRSKTREQRWNRAERGYSRI